jgi:hypothetical protein
VVSTTTQGGGQAVDADYVEIVSEYGSNSTIMTDYLQPDLRRGSSWPRPCCSASRRTQSFGASSRQDMKAFR